MSDETHGENVLPPAVRKAAAQADAIIADLNKSQNDPASEPASDPAQPAQEPAPAPAAASSEPASEPASDPAPKREDWKQKYNVLKGKYDAEVPRLSAELRESRTAIAGLQEQVTNLNVTLAAVKEVQKEPPAPAPKPVLTPEEIDNFGPDLIDVIERKAQEVADRMIADRIGKVESSVKQVSENVASTQKSVAESARERLYTRLDDEVAGWETINKQPAFVDWLRVADDFSGQPRGALLRAAFERNDADRVVKIFKSFQAENVGDENDPDPSAPTGDDPAPTGDDPAPAGSQQGLDELVAPGTPKTGSSDAQQESGKGRIWTQSDIRAFYTRKNELIKARPNAELPEDMLQAERDIFVAQREGRVRA